MTKYSPSADSAITQKYGAETLQDKVQNKTALQEELGWLEEPKRAMICIPTEMSDKMGGNLLKEVLPGLLHLPVEILILGKGSASYGTYLTEVAKKHGDRVAIIANDEKMIRKMYAASDMALFLVKPAPTDELEACLSYGVIPVAPADDKLADYNPNQESGDAFLYNKETVWHCFAACVRALETFKFPYDWRTIQKAAMVKAK